MKISDVKKFDIIRFYTNFYVIKKLSGNTINSIHVILSSVFKFAVADSFLRFNACEGCMKEIKKIVKQRNPLSRREQEILMSFVRNNKHYSKYYPMIATFLGTGIRVSELVGLTCDDIDLNNRILIVDHQVIYSKLELNHHVNFVFLSRMQKPFMNTSIEYIFRNIVKE